MKGKLLAFGVSLLAVATIGVVQLPTKAVDSSRDCDQFAIIRCGAMNADELRTEYESNNKAGANGSTEVQGDIKKVFTAMGISKADLSGGFKQGVVYKNGTVEVDGKVVATNAQMAARGLGGTQIEGTNAQKVSVSAMSEAQSAMVKMDANGKFLFAVMKPCANPVTATPKEQPQPPEPKPTAKCVDVTVKQEGEPNRYVATARAEVANGATIKAYTFKVTKDGRTLYDNTYQNAKTEQALVYILSEPGTYNVKVTVDTSEGVKQGAQCETSFTVPKPPTTTTTPPPAPTPGVSIDKFVDNDKKYTRVNTNVEFSYRIVVTNTGEADLDNVVVTDTPDRAITLVSVTPPSGTITKNVFSYTIPKLLKSESRSFILTAKVPVAQAGKLINTVCVDAPAVTGAPDMCAKAEVEVPPTPVPGKKEVCLKAEDRLIMISENEFNSTIHSYDFNECDTVDVATVTELPQTGPVETVVSVIGAMSLVGASAYYLASRRTV